MVRFKMRQCVIFLWSLIFLGLGSGLVACGGGVSLETSIDEDALEDITASNVVNYTLSGTCSDNEQPVIVTIGSFEIETECEEKAWEVSANLIGLNKISGDIEITVQHFAAGSEDEEEAASEGVLSLTVTATVTNEFVCPGNFVGVSALEGYTEDSFCVSKYEMKDDGSGNAVSQTADAPYVGLTRDEAVAKCTSAGYSLSTNDEWQTVGRDIELTDSNWEGGEAGSAGGLSRGHSDDSPSNALAASDDDNNGCEGTEETCDGSTWDAQRRTHTLSHGEVIWDLAGNVSEWVKDSSSSAFDADAYISQVTESTHASSVALSGGTTTTARIAKNQFGPVGDYVSLSSGDYGGLGYGLLSGTAGAIYRGGLWNSLEEAGVFNVSLDSVGDSGSTEIGFRCTHHP